MSFTQTELHCKNHQFILIDDNTLQSSFLSLRCDSTNEKSTELVQTASGEECLSLPNCSVEFF